MAFSQSDELLARQLIQAGRLQADQLDQLRALAEERGCGLRALLSAADDRTLQGAAVGGGAPEDATLVDPEANRDLVASSRPASELASAETYLSYDSAPPLSFQASWSTKTAASSAKPDRIGPYEILGTLGRGGMGVVYKARHTGLDRVVALKVLIPDRDASARALERFLLEAKTAASLDTHPNIVSVLDSGSADGVSYMAMELVEGAPLDVLIKAGKARPRAAARVLADIADALDFAHSRGVIHRDIKPSNIMVSRQSKAKLNDFGVAKIAQEEQGQTRTGAMIGTVAYMSPEQAEDSKSIDARSDIYSLGAVLYTVLAGRPPYVGATAANVLSSMLRSEAPPPSSLKDGVDPSLEAICLKALARDPDARFQTAAALRDALNAYRAGDTEALAHIEQGPAKPRRAWLVPALVVGAALLTLAAALGLRGAPPRYRLSELSPASDRPLKTGRFELRGRIEPAPAKVAVGQLEARVEGGRFSIPLTLKEGVRSVRLEALPEDGDEPILIAEPSFIVDLSPPRLSLDSPLPDSASEPSLSLSGTCEDPAIPGRSVGPSTLALQINDQDVPLTRGRFQITAPLEPGANLITYRLTDAAGHSKEGRWSISYLPPEPRTPEPTPPEPAAPKAAPAKTAAPEPILLAFTCPDGDWLKSPQTTLQLRCRRPPTRVLLQHQDQIRDLDLVGGAEISMPITLDEGSNRIEVEVFRSDGSERAALLLSVDSIPPKLRLSINKAFELSGFVDEKNLAELTLDGEVQTLNDGYLKAALGRERARAGVMVRALDRAGNLVEKRLRRVPLTLIKDRDRWNKASAADQDEEIAVIAEAINRDFAFIETREYACGEQRHRLASFRHRASGLTLHLIPGDRAAVGLARGAVSGEVKAAMALAETADYFSEAELKQWIARECSRVAVRLAPFLIGADEVSEEAWDRVLGRMTREKQAKRRVDFTQAEDWLAKTRGLRLPSEAEWEYAARAGAETRYFWGSSAEDLPRYAAWSGRGQPINFAGVAPNAFGLVHTLGGVWEWCADDFEDSHNRLPRDGAPLSSSRAEGHVRKGGSFLDPRVWLRCTARGEGLWSQPRRRRPPDPRGGRPPRGSGGRRPPVPRPPPQPRPGPKSADAIGLRVACSLPEDL